MTIDMKDKTLKYVSRMDDIKMMKVDQEINETKEGITARRVPVPGGPISGKILFLRTLINFL